MYLPSVREICEVVVKSTSTVHGHLARLEKKAIFVGPYQTPRH